MAANEKAQSVAADTGQGAKAQKCHAKILSPNGDSVNTTDWLTDFRVRRKMKGTEIVETVRSLFPGFDKALLSKCMRPDYYGIRLSPEAQELLEKTYGGEENDGPA